jgi:hypothetical protein
LGLYVARGANGLTGYALSASGTAVLSGFSGVSLNATAQVRVNTLGQAVNQSVVVGGQTVTVAFGSTAQVQEVLVSSGTLTVSGLGSLSGALAIKSSTTGSGASAVTQLQVGMSGVSGALTLGGALSATLSNGQGAVLLKKVGTAAGTYAVQAEGDVSVSGASAVTLSATQMRVGYNRMGAAVNETVSTGSGSYAVSLIEGETRLRGVASASVANVLSVNGEIFVESVSGVSQTLSDGTTVKTDQLILGGAGINAAVGASGVGASLTNVDVAMVLSTEVVTGNATARRWLSSHALVGGASVSGYALADIKSASLEINRNLSSDTGPVVDWSKGAKTVTLSASKSAVLNDAAQTFHLAVDGSIAMGPAKLGGAFDLSYQPNGAGTTDDTWTLSASSVRVGVASGTMEVGLQEGAGTLVLGQTSRSGTISGKALIAGVDGLSFSGVFAATFDAQGGLSVAGTAALGVSGFGSLSGDFSAVKESGANGRLLVGASNVDASLGSSGVGVKVTGASLGMVLTRNAAGQNVYALQADGSAALQGMGNDVSLSATGTVRINNLGATVDQVIQTGLNSTMRLQFASAAQVQELSVTSGTLTVSGLGSLSGALAIKSSTTGSGASAVTQLQVGMSGVSGALTLGGALSATLSNGQGAVLLLSLIHI